MKIVHEHISEDRLAGLSSATSTITERMRLGGRIIAEDFGKKYHPFAEHASDTVRGWAAYAISLLPGMSLPQRLKAIRPLADDSHFGVREWAWMGIRPHLAAELDLAIELLTPWTSEDSLYLRRFATESTRPRGVWCEHIVRLKEEPQLGLPLLEPLKADGEKYVQDSVSNWLNDAAKSQPEWVQELCQSWVDDAEGDKATLRICRRAVRSLKSGDADSD